MSFDPGDVGIKGRLFGFPYSVDESELVVLPVPWEATVSFGAGTARAPARILDASSQLDFAIPGYPDPWLFKVALDEIREEWAQLSHATREKAKRVITALEADEEPTFEDIQEVNKASVYLNAQVEQMASRYLDEGKWVATLGGDHSTPLGLLKALGKKSSFGILQIDAHMDLRAGYEGFTYSHASIMYHALGLPGVKSLTQVGIRDFSPEEVMRAQQHGVHVFYQEYMEQALHSGNSWASYIHEVVSTLPDSVYVSLDVDSLSPSLCPNTGTPVPGGLDFYQVVTLLEAIVDSGRTMIGFDLSETGNDAWDANVSARLLYRLSVALARSQGRLSLVDLPK